MTDGTTAYIRANNEWVPLTTLSSATLTGTARNNPTVTTAVYNWRPYETTLYYPYTSIRSDDLMQAVTIDDFVKVGSGENYDVYVPKEQEEIRESDMSIEELLEMG